MQLIVSDANILIDMEEGGLLVSMFSLHLQFIIPNTVFDEELAQRHGNLLELGLGIRFLSSESMLRVFELAKTYRRTSRHDLVCLSLAKQEDCSLLTGDKSLRKAAEQEKVSVHGTIWLVEKLVRDGKISIAAAKAAYEQMKDAGSRIPWKRAKDGLRAIEQGGWS